MGFYRGLPTVSKNIYLLYNVINILIINIKDMNLSNKTLKIL